MKDGNYKPGDYIASDGHAALIVGVDENMYMWLKHIMLMLKLVNLKIL